MANNLSEFVAHIKKNSIARVNRFRVQFTVPQKVVGLSNYIGKGDINKILSLTCLITDVPGQTNQTSVIGYGNYDRRVVWGRSLGDFSTSFLVTGKYVEKKVFDVWTGIMHDEGNHAVEFYDEYITTIYLECLNEQDEVMYRLELTEAYPLVVGNLKLDRTAQNAQMLLDVNWAYHRCETILDNVTMAPQFSDASQIPPVAVPGPNAGKQRLLAIPGIDQMSAAVQSAAAVGTEFRGQLQGVLNIAKDVREQVRDFKMEAINGVKILNGVVKDVKAINGIPTDVKNEVVAVVTDTKNQIGYLKNDIKNISNYPQR
jgi:hypothetical protein